MGSIKTTMNKAISLAAVLNISAFQIASAGLDSAPGIDNGVKQLQDKIKTDLSTGAITQADADGVNTKLGELKRMEDSAERGGRITPRTRKDLHGYLDRATTELARKEKQQAAAAGSPAAGTGLPK